MLGFAKNLTENYKQPARFWMGPFFCVYVTEPNDLQIILNHPNALNKTFIYNFGDDFVGKSLLTAESKLWRQRRRIIEPTFHIKILETYIKTFERQSEVLVRELDKTNGKTVDVFNYLNKCTMDMISSTAFDTELNSQTTKIGDELVLATKK